MDYNRYQCTIVHNYTTIVYSNSIHNSSVGTCTLACARTHQLTDCMWAGKPGQLSSVQWL